MPYEHVHNFCRRHRSTGLDFNVRFPRGRSSRRGIVEAADGAQAKLDVETVSVVSRKQETGLTIATSPAQPREIVKLQRVGHWNR